MDLETKGGRLRAVRNLLGMSQEDFAMIFRVFYTKVGKLERNEKTMTADDLTDLETVGINPTFVRANRGDMLVETKEAVIEKIRGLTSSEGEDTKDYKPTI